MDAAVRFKMWSFFHIVYIIIPIAAAIALHLIFRKKSERVKWAIALALAIVNMAILITRNVDIAIRSGLDAEVIPLGPCHFANIIFLVAVLSKKQSWYNIAWCLNLPFGFLAIVFSNSLANYSTLLAIRPMAYLLGHFFLVVSILYVFFAGITRFDKGSFKGALKISGVWLACCLAANIIFNLISDGDYGFANYMYLMKPEGGTPLEIIYGLAPAFRLGNMNIDALYIILLSITGIVLFVMFQLLHWVVARALRGEFRE